ncbi:hypothetical protein [Rhodopila sp.]|uniref:hypothetical protein n=1 Tax=Rhodopila sp. TaxID=2480087 RepID=UPI003D11E3B5
MDLSRRVLANQQFFDPALREFLDEFYADPVTRPVSLQDQPELIEDIKDAYLAATAEHLSATYGLDLPAWVADHGRPLRRAFFAGGLESVKAILTVESPAAFRRRLLFVGKDALDRPRRLSDPPPRKPALAHTLR